MLTLKTSPRYGKFRIIFSLALDSCVGTFSTGCLQLYEEFTSGTDSNGFFLPTCTLDIYLASGMPIVLEEYKELYNSIIESQLREHGGPEQLVHLLNSLEAVLKPYKLKNVDIPLRWFSLHCSLSFNSWWGSFFLLSFGLFRGLEFNAGLDCRASVFSPRAAKRAVASCG